MDSRLFTAAHPWTLELALARGGMTGVGALDRVRRYVAPACCACLQVHGYP